MQARAPPGASCGANAAAAAAATIAEAAAAAESPLPAAAAAAPPWRKYLALLLLPPPPLLRIALPHLHTACRTRRLTQPLIAPPRLPLRRPAHAHATSPPRRRSRQDADCNEMLEVEPSDYREREGEDPGQGGIPPDQQRLIRGERRRGRPHAGRQHPEGVDAAPVLLLRGGLNIKVKTLTGKEIEIDIEIEDTIARIKERAEEKRGSRRRSSASSSAASRWPTTSRRGTTTSRAARPTSCRLARGWPPLDARRFLNKRYVDINNTATRTHSRLRSPAAPTPGTTS